MSRRRYSYTWIKIAIIALAILLFVFLGAVPLLEGYLESSGVSLHSLPFYETLERVRTMAMELLIAAWFFAFGSMVGSFANVVVYRMPQRLSIVASPSACPYCAAKIKLTDNIPIFGWLKLGGRCRTCRLPISPRYPIVELIFGVCYVLLFFVELQTGGTNLPDGATASGPSSILSVFINPPWPLIGLYALHCTLISLLLIWALITYDRHALPLRTIVFALVVGLVAVIIWPHLHPVKWIDQHEQWFQEVAWLKRIDSGFLGLTSGFLLGGLLDQLLAKDIRGESGATSNDSFSLMAVGLMTIGLYLGWQATMTISLVFSVCFLVHRLASRGSKSATRLAGFWMAASTLLYICVWNDVESIFRLAPAASKWLLYLGCAGVAVGVIALGRLVSNRGYD